ncbi:TadE family protein [Actinoplanes derwentensis]|uniref:TadE family protein n=1 Tax=Actinoplanes derwentensis TaxID=113562 RepID=UPI0022B26891|nr:TadE family protein [Actinoplanes derwentensis]
MVEMAIVLPVLLLILFGIIDMGRALQQNIQLTQAAREGARLGALNGTVTDVKTKITTIVGSGTALNYPTNGVQVCSSSSLAGTDSTVVVERQFRAVTPVMAWITRAGGSSTIILRGKGVMSCVG